MTAALALLRRDRGLGLGLALLLLGLPLVTTRIYASDEIKYFAYLHSLSFDRDLDFTNDYQHWIDPPYNYADIRSLLKRNPATGLPINEAPIGTALLWAPAFALAHVGVLLARALGARIAADGYSPPYIAAVCYVSYLYGAAGLLLIYGLLRRRFAPLVATLAVLTTWLGTAAFFYMVIAPPWSHAASLFTVSLFTTAWLRTGPVAHRTLRGWAALGVCAGLMMLVREQDALFLTLPAVETLAFLWARSTGRGARVETRGPPAGGRRPYEGANPPKARAEVRPPIAVGVAVGRLVLGWAVVLAGAAVTFTPQLAAYWVLGGRLGPSSTVSEKLNWASPHALEVLLAPAYGLLPWAPVVALALVGLGLLAGQDGRLGLALIVGFLAQVYVAGAFSTWLGASSFGQRRFVNCTAIFAFGLAALLAWALARGVPRLLLVALAGVAVAWEAGLILQYAAWDSARRQAGLQWPGVLADQVRAYSQAPEKVWQFLFNRSSLTKRGMP